MADLVIDTGYKKRFAKESLLSLPELMLRWPFQCFLKIPFQLFNKRLISYFLLENHTSTNGEQIVQVCKTIDGHFSLSFIISFFGSFVFKIKNIEKEPTGIAGGSSYAPVNGTANIMWYLPRNIAGRFSTAKRSVKLVRYCANYVNGKGWRFLKRNVARITYICCLKYRPR